MQATNATYLVFIIAVKACHAAGPLFVNANLPLYYIYPLYQPAPIMMAPSTSAFVFPDDWPW